MYRRFNGEGTMETRGEKGGVSRGAFSPSAVEGEGEIRRIWEKESQTTVQLSVAH